MKKRTKILATIGPASDSLEMIEKLIRAGVNVFRLNFSHGTYEYHSEVLERIRIAEKNTGLLTGVMQDISGPKIRVGMIDVEAGELAVGRQVDAGLTLDVENHARGINHRLLTWEGGEPIWNRIGTDRGGEDAGLGGYFECHGKE